MSAKERILTIRLMEKVSARPAYAQALGIVVLKGPAENNRQTDPRSASNKS